MRERVLAYYFLLRKALRDRTDLRACLTRCRHCRIIFLTHRRNGHRKDLRCPFGCRAAHRKKRSAERSAAYYRTAAGKRKKARINRKRSQARHDSATKPVGVGTGEAQHGSVDVANNDLTQSTVDGGPAGVEVRSTDCADLPSTAVPSKAGVMSVIDHADPDAEFDAEIVEHVRLVAGLIERRAVSREEILTMLAKAVRQHRIGREKRFDYVLAWLKKHPP